MSHKIKVLIQDNVHPDRLANKIYRMLDNPDEVHIFKLKEERIRYIPENFDSYLIHLSTLEEWREIGRLRGNQPWSWIYIRTGGRTPSTIIDGCDGIYEEFCRNNIKKILTQTDNFRRFRDKK